MCIRDRFIQEGDSIILDSGSTTTEIAKLLMNYKDLTVITNACLLYTSQRLENTADGNLWLIAYDRHSLYLYDIRENKLINVLKQYEQHFNTPSVSYTHLRNYQFI